MGQRQRGKGRGSGEDIPTDPFAKFRALLEIFPVYPEP